MLMHVAEASSAAVLQSRAPRFRAANYMRKRDTGGAPIPGRTLTDPPAPVVEVVRRRRAPADQLAEIAARTEDPEDRTLLLRQASALREIAARRLARPPSMALPRAIFARRAHERRQRP